MCDSNYDYYVGLRPSSQVSSKHKIGKLGLFLLSDVRGKILTPLGLLEIMVILCRCMTSLVQFECHLVILTVETDNGTSWTEISYLAENISGQ